ncbi:unnamed protein product [Clavelina lepadiformis]|uniref:Uncharacterized protein n=1 Tax=Clavelina lepadiformis TaxID=159417 RepID=A0ABP0GUL7_CLALP
MMRTFVKKLCFPNDVVRANFKAHFEMWLVEVSLLKRKQSSKATLMNPVAMISLCSKLCHTSERIKIRSKLVQYHRRAFG